jgi:hypothetical protein
MPRGRKCTLDKIKEIPGLIPRGRQNHELATLARCEDRTIIATRRCPGRVNRHGAALAASAASHRPELANWFLRQPFPSCERL